MTEITEACAARCGLFCGACPAFPDKCRGCLSDFVREGCFNCETHGFMACAQKHHITRCCECVEFPCKKLEEFSKGPVIDGVCNHADVIADSKRIKEIGVGGWIGEQRKKFICPKCGARLTWFNKHKHVCA